jgi:hypothetical protein
MKTTSIVCVLWSGLALSSAAQSTIAYYDGPAFPIPSYYALDEDTGTIDFDKDGVADFSLFGGVAMTTGFSITEPYYIAALNTNNVLCRGYNVVVMPWGTLIGSAPPGSAGWSNNIDGAILTEFGETFDSGGVGIFPILLGSNSVASTAGPAWGGPLSSGQEGYLGVRFYAGDGLHYGWIHASLAGDSTLGPSPTITDWAYETRPNTPILAGALPLAALSEPQIVRPQNLRLVWPSEIGRAYQLQFKNQVDAPDWSDLGLTIIATATSTAVDAPISGSAGFYRVVRVE